MFEVRVENNIEFHVLLFSYKSPDCFISQQTCYTSGDRLNCGCVQNMQDDTIKNTYKILSGIIGLLGFYILIFSLSQGNSGVSFATFIFWTLIAGLNAYATFKEHGNFTLSLTLTLGNFLTALVLLLKGNVSWGMPEWFAAALLIPCLLAWRRSTRNATIIVSTIAITIGGVPQLLLAWNEPAKISIVAWSIFCISSFIGVLAGKNWSVKERLYPIARFSFYGLIVLLALKRFF